jgi:hypothetical protein
VGGHQEGVSHHFGSPGCKNVCPMPWSLYVGSRWMVNSTYMIFQPAIMSGDGRPGLRGMDSPRPMLALICIQSTWNTFSAIPRDRICHQINEVAEQP